MYKIEIQLRSTGNWSKVFTKNELETIEAAQVEYTKYNTPTSNWGFARITKDGEVIETNEGTNFWKK